MIAKLLFSPLLLSVQFFAYSQANIPTVNYQRSIELLNEQKVTGDSLIRLFMLSRYGPLIMHKFEKMDSGYLNTTKFLFLENKEQDLITLTYSMSSSDWQKAFNILGRDFQNMDSIEIEKNPEEPFRLIEFVTPSASKLIQRPNRDFKTQKAFKNKWWELRSLTIISVKLDWLITDLNGNPIEKAIVDLSNDNYNHKSDKDGLFQLQSAIEFFDRSKRYAWIRTDEFKLKRVDIDLKLLKRSSEDPSVILSEINLQLEE